MPNEPGQYFDRLLLAERRGHLIKGSVPKSESRIKSANVRPLIVALCMTRVKSEPLNRNLAGDRNNRNS